MTLLTLMMSNPGGRVGGITWQEALKIAEAANVKNTFLFIMTLHNDERMDQIAQEAATINSGVPDPLWKAKRLHCNLFNLWSTERVKTIGINIIK